jgi:hypothetical protein
LRAIILGKALTPGFSRQSIDILAMLSENMDAMMPIHYSAVRLHFERAGLPRTQRRDQIFL